MGAVARRDRLLRVVSIASASGRYGGPFDTACRQALVLSESLQVTIAAGYFAGDIASVAPQVRAAFFRVRALAWFAEFSGAFSVTALRTLWSETKRADFVHVSIAREAVPIAAATMARFHGRTLVIQPHGMLTSRTSFAHRTFDVPLRALLGRRPRVIALTEREADELRRWFGPRAQPRITVLGNPLPALPTRSTSKDSKDVLFLARLHPRKRVEDFVEAATYASASGLAGDYVVVGPDEGDLHLVEAASYRVQNLSYEGVLSADEVTVRLSRARVFVLPSLNEPWGNVLVAALALGIPVVVTESAALAASIGEFDAGVVVPDRSPLAIASAVDRLLNNEGEYAEKVAGALNLAADKFGSDQQKSALLHVLGVGPAGNEERNESL